MAHNIVNLVQILRYILTLLLIVLPLRSIEAENLRDVLKDAYNFFPDIKKAENMKIKLKKRFSTCKNLEFIICSGKNSGADIQFK